MPKTYLTSTSTAMSNFPKKLLIWNYWDHEHVVGTHFEHYKKVKITFENENECHSERWAKLPYFPFYIKSSDVLILNNENEMEALHTTLFKLIKCKQVFLFNEKEENKCEVTRKDFLEIPKFLKFLQPIFDKLMKKWFVDVWEEDMPMRERRLKVWKLGFKDFQGIDYINDPNTKGNDNTNRKYQLELPIPKITHINKNKKNKIFKRLFNKSKHVGYGLPDL